MSLNFIYTDLILSLSSAVILPHIGSATLETRVEMAKRAARNLVNGLLGREMEAEVQLD